MPTNFIGNWPNQVPSFFHRDESCRLFSSVITLCSGPSAGAIVLQGTGGVGKTTMAVYSLRREFEIDKLNVELAVWLNCGQISSTQKFDDEDLYRLIRQTFVNSDLMGENAESTPGNIKRCLEAMSRRVLFVLDDVFNIGVLRCMSKLGSNVRALAITRNYQKAKYQNDFFHCESFSLNLLSQESLETMLFDFFDLASKGLDRQKQIPKLANICLGLPLIASVVHARFRKIFDEKRVDDCYWSLVRNYNEIAQLQAPFDKIADDDEVEMVLSNIITYSPEFESEFFSQRMSSLVVFPPGQPISHLDLQIYWHCESANDVLNFCQEAVDASLLQQTSDGFILHDLLHKSLLKRLGAKDLQEATARLVNESLKFEGSFKQNCLKRAIEADRFEFAALFCSFGDNSKLAELCSENQSLTLHLLIEIILNGKLCLKNEGKPTESSLTSELFCHLTDTCLREGHEEAIDSKLITKITLSMISGLKWYRNLFLTAFKLLCSKLVLKLLSDSTVKPVVNVCDADGNNALLHAIESFQRETLQALIGSRLFDINHRNKQGETALWLSTRHALCLEIVKILREDESLDVNIVDNNAGSSVLHEAVVNNRLEVVKFLVEELGADIRMDNKLNRKNALELALTTYDRSEIGAYLLTRPEALMTPSVFKEAVAKARHLKQSDIVQLLRENFQKLSDNYDNRNDSIDEEKAADEYAQQFGQTIVEGNLEALLQLKELDADKWNREVTGIESNGLTALMAACIYNHTEIVRFLLSYGSLVTLNSLTKPENRSALISACSNGNFEIAKLLIELGANVDFIDEDGSNAFLEACNSGSTDCVDLLLERTDNVNIQDKIRRSGLMAACHKGFADIACRLIEKGADPDSQACDGMTALMLACESGHSNLVEILLKKTAVNFDLQNSSGFTALNYSCQGCHTSIARTLLDAGAEMELKTVKGDTALMFVSDNGCCEIGSMLLQRGANVNTQNDRGDTALFRSCIFGNVDMVRLLLSYEANVNMVRADGSTALMASCQIGNLDISNLLLEHNADYKAVNNSGVSALCVACCNGSVDVVKLLLSFPGMDEIESMCPLLLASASGCLEILPLLLDYGFDIDSHSEAGITALMEACTHGHEDVAKLLIERGADLTISQKQGVDAFVIACLNGLSEVVKAIMAKESAFLNKRYFNGMTPLMLACQKGQTKLVEDLLNLGAIINCQSESGFSAVHEAVKANESETVRLLIASGADLTLKTSAGQTALDLAIESEAHEIIALFDQEQA